MLKRDDSFDLDNSDELNRIIGKYETTIVTGKEHLRKTSEAERDCDLDLDLVEKEVTAGSITSSAAKKKPEVKPLADQAAVVISKDDDYDQNSFDDDNETIDEFIKKHLNEEPNKEISKPAAAVS